MTVPQYVTAVLRRWYVLVAVLICTCGVILVLPRDTGVYWGRADVVFLSPSNKQLPSNVLATVDESVIYFAAAVERMVDAGHGQPALASPTATLYGTGMRHGYSIQLYNSGGQWASNFERPMLSVQVVGTSRAEAQETLAAVVHEIEDVARRRQLEARATTATMITTEVAPAQLAVARLKGSWVKGASVVGLLGLVVAAAAAVVLDNALVGRRPPAAAVPAEEERSLVV